MNAGVHLERAATSIPLCLSILLNVAIYVSNRRQRANDGEARANERIGDRS
jgi:hypothetical protein